VFTLKNTSNSEQHFDWGKFIAMLIDAEGEKVEYNQVLLKPSRDERASSTLNPGEEAKVRFFSPYRRKSRAKACYSARAKKAVPLPSRCPPRLEDAREYH
jgi:hypothetical protein